MAFRIESDNSLPFRIALLISPSVSVPTNLVFSSKIKRILSSSLFSNLMQSLIEEVDCA